MADRHGPAGVLPPAPASEVAPRRLPTALTALLGIEHPVLLAPVEGLATPALACAVSAAGGLGTLGAGYADAAALRAAMAACGGARTGCGFVGWLLAHRPHLLEVALDHRPAAVTISFGPFAPSAARVRERGVPLICQVATVREAEEALAESADVVVATGTEAAGHGTHTRSTLTLVPEIHDLVVRSGLRTPVVAAGGIADGRGLAAALVLGAAGALVGTALAPCPEAPVSDATRQRLRRASGDDTMLTTVSDRFRGVRWPRGYSTRILSSPSAARWHGHEAQLDWELADVAERYRQGVRTGDPDWLTVTAGEAVGLVAGSAPVEAVIHRMVDDAATLLGRRDVPQSR